MWLPTYESRAAFRRILAGERNERKDDRMTYDPREQDEIAAEFDKLLRSCTRDGGNKRAAGTKPPWTVDPDHEKHFWNHVAAWKRGELHDPDSNEHPLAHAAWRLLALAWQAQHVGQVEAYHSPEELKEAVLHG